MSLFRSSEGWRRPLARGGIVALLIVLAGCDVPTACTAALPAAIRVFVVDAQSSQRIAAGATLNWTRHGGTSGSDHVANDAASADTIPLFVFAGPGVYDLTVSKSGYVTATQRDVNVASGDACGRPEFVSLSIALSKQP